MSNIYFFQFDKRPNSTKVPALSIGVQVNCRIKDASSLLAPVLEIHRTGLFNFNYCYIPDFKRFYFIDDVVLDQNVFTVTTHCDVLATYKNDIRSSSQYVARSSSNYNGLIVDNLYAAVTPTGFSKTASVQYPGVTVGGVLTPDYVKFKLPNGSSGVAPYFNVKMTSGYFVIGITGRDNATGTSFYCLNYSSFKSFITNAFTLNPSDMSDVSSGIANAIYDPISYITFCRWYPDVSYGTVTAVSSIYVGRYPVSFTGSAYPLSQENICRYQIEIPLPVHPNITNRKYLNLAPYTELQLYMEPFGNIPIDTVKVTDMNSLPIEWDVDYCSGIAILKIRNSTWNYPDDHSLIYSNTADYGVPIPISSLSYDWKSGAVMSGLTFIKMAAESAMAKSTGSKPSYMPQSYYDTHYSDLTDRNQKNIELIGSVIDAVGSSLGQLHTSGTSGSFMAFNTGAPVIYGWFMDQVEYDDARFGRPLYQKKTLSNLSGFCLCLNASITTFTTKPLSTEYSAIIDYLNSGVYLE